MPKYCLKCMQEVKDAKVCPHCGASLLEVMENPAHALPVGSVLNGRYMVGSIIGQGGFGITYIGLDQLLGMRVAIKEYFPSGHVNRNTQVTHQITCSSERQKQFLEKGKKRFLQEAKVLASFHGINGVVDVRDFFELNDTAYIIMEYLDGEDLRSYLERNRFTSDEIFGLMEPIFRALREIHKKGIVHRDISPDNIMMMKDGTLKLMDFGAARFSNAEDDHSVSIMLKNGYAPEEQYRSKGKQGPWTDIYALCATIYKCITGIKIDDALDRMADDRIKWPSELGYAISEEQESVLKKGLKVFARDRIQSLDELIEMLRTEGRTTTDEDSRTASAEEQLRDDAKITEEIHSEEELTVYEEIKKTVTEGDREKTVAEETGEVTVYEDRTGDPVPDENKPNDGGQTVLTEKHFWDDKNHTEEAQGEEGLTVYEEIQENATDDVEVKTVVEEKDEDIVFDGMTEESETSGTGKEEEEGDKQTTYEDSIEILERKRKSSHKYRSKLMAAALALLALTVSIFAIRSIGRIGMNNTEPSSGTISDSSTISGENTQADAVAIMDDGNKDSMLWGSHLIVQYEDMSLDFSRHVTIDGVEMTVSSFPVSIEGYPTESGSETESIITFYTDQWDKVQFNGTYHIGTNNRVSLHLTSLINGGDVTVHDSFEYILIVEQDQIKLLTQAGSNYYQSEWDIYNPIGVEGEINEGTPAYKDMVSLHFLKDKETFEEYSVNNIGAEVITLTDGSEHVASIDWSSSNGYRWDLSWKEGDDNSVLSLPYVINTFPYGFVIVDGNEMYCYQNGAYELRKKTTESRSSECYEYLGEYFGDWNDTSVIVYSYEGLMNAIQKYGLRDWGEEWVHIRYKGKEPLVIQDSLTLDSPVMVHVDKPFIVPENVTVEVKKGRVYLDSVVIEGELICDSGVLLSVSTIDVKGTAVVDTLEITGSNPDQKVEGLENITYTWYPGYYFEPEYCNTSTAEKWLERARSGAEPDFGYRLYNIYSWEEGDLIIPDSLPESVDELSLIDGHLIVPSTSNIQLPYMNIYLVGKSRITIEGNLSIQSVAIHNAQDNTENAGIMTLSGDGSYQGDIEIWDVDKSFDVSDVLSGFEISQDDLRYDSEYGRYLFTCS